MYRFSITTLLIVLSSLLAFCQEASVISKEVEDNIRTRVDKGINPGIVVGIIDAEGTRYFSYGSKSLKTKGPVDEHAVFEIGSITKTFTGILLADMVLKKKMKLDNPIQMYLPGGITAPTRNEEPIRLVHLANHTSSLPRMPDNFNPKNPGNPFADYTEELMFQFLNTYELTRDIGSKFEYSNYAMGLLGHILATQNGTSYEEMMIKTIAQPLGMSDTRIAFTPKMKENLAMGHSGGVEVENWDLPAMAGAGAIRSTAVDMLKYLSANMGLEKSKLLPAMRLAHKNSGPVDSALVVGLGWLTRDLDEVEIITHSGGTGGYRTFAGFIKNGNKGVVVLTNSTVGVDDIGLHILHEGSSLQEPWNRPEEEEAAEIEMAEE
ncbi:MAG: beta-lactamase family protein, partial [Cyclobacteriaceae bacterium]|nr:beta-lactamase family protein [Cyclobacteriaceae bacterium]